MTDIGMEATARAQPNIALVKYWGKRDTAENLPAVDSLSLTLDELYTDMRVRFDASLAADELTVNGAPQARLLPRVSRCLDAVGGRGRPAAAIESRTNFPVGAGLASSAAAFAALVVAAAAAIGRDADTGELASLAGRASGSAARSLYPGVVLLERDGGAPGSRDKVGDSLSSKGDVRVTSILAPAEWALRVVAAVTETKPKSRGSGEAMEISRSTSPFYRRWVDEQPRDLEAALAAVAARDLAALGRVAEHNCLKMHSVMWTSRPALVYWNAATVGCLETVRRLQAEGVDVFFTIDAGPQVKAVCTAGSEPLVRAALAATPGVETVLSSGLGAGARVTEFRR
ncbi:MAG TPA: diphosphomevalonate decarboxylase [Woeseiaceae bacterium]|nr:diphosphomevalonate decarboxylase [Woeseiaceae bacterium]